MTLELQATAGEVMRAVEALQDLAQTMRLGEREIFGLALALEECGSNIVNHAYRRDARQKFLVTIEHRGGAVRIELRDHGPEFDPTRRCAAEPAAGGDDRTAGGWGIQLARRYVDQIIYLRENEENVLRLIKHLPRSTGQE